MEWSYQEKHGVKCCLGKWARSISLTLHFRMHSYLLITISQEEQLLTLCFKHVPKMSHPKASGLPVLLGVPSLGPQNEDSHGEFTAAVQEGKVLCA